MPVTSNEVVTTVPKTFTEVAPPEVIQTLRSSLEIYQPQVSIVSPQPEEVFTDNKVNVKLEVHDLPLFKDSKLQLGPHLHLILDNEPYRAVYDVYDGNNPIILSDLTPGTHTLRVFASRPWHESFKNEGAYAQTTFHIFTKTEENNPSAELPLLTYSRPNGTYGAEPIMLDFYLTNAPLQSVVGDNNSDNMSNWRIRCTINDESFILDRWQPVYLKGFKPGKNWVKLEFLDNSGQPVKNAFNSTTRVINYEPNGQDTLSKIVRGDVTADDVRGIVDAGYQVQTPVVPTVEETPVPEAKVEKPATPEVKVSEPESPQVETPQVEVSPTPEVKVSEPESPQVETPQVEVSEIGTSDTTSTNAK
ncbi:hypothetical protein H6F32_10945 [Anabaena sp. FACHB-1237]|uniref:hypothetical protein n=1 Tax=Anabaena sp. FACHB-1237 TaxID=2692769 RepID=UPI00168142B5|nr:hypothetical protein [Anabaena sp. FACHB-1237]MBD2138094.1 hypothetical protein [Anabaena sp. FACHB-1237]